jgi:hypothetical protein
MLPRTPSAATQTSSAREICNNVQQETWSSEMLDVFLLYQNVLELSNISLELITKDKNHISNTVLI